MPKTRCLWANSSHLALMQNKSKASCLRVICVMRHIFASASVRFSSFYMWVFLESCGSSPLPKTITIATPSFFQSDKRSRNCQQSWKSQVIINRMHCKRKQCLLKHDGLIDHRLAYNKKKHNLEIKNKKLLLWLARRETKNMKTKKKSTELDFIS